MAARSSKLMDEISEQFLICTICCEMYKTPKALNCMHAFCAHCLEKHLESEQERTYRYMLYTRSVSCPVCRKKTEIPNGGVRKLPDSFLLSNLIDILERRKADPDKIPTCEICKPSTKYAKHFATSKCLECNKVLCRSCCEMHKSTKVTQTHNLFDIDVEKDIQCKLHAEEGVRYYCEPCQVCICVLCTFEEHKNHEVTTINEGISKHRDSLDNLLDKCKDRIDCVKDRIQMIRECENRIKEVEDVIRDTSINCISSIRQRERLLTQELREYYGKATYDFMDEKSQLKQSMESLQSTCNLTELVLKDKNIELLLLKKDLHGKLLSLTEEKMVDPPKRAQKQVNFIQGTLNLGFLAFNGGPPPTLDLHKDTRCQCRHSVTDKVDNCTMTSSPEMNTKHTLTEPGHVMKRMTQTDPVTVLEKCSDLSDDETISNQSDTETESESIDTSSFLDESTDCDDISEISSCNISFDDLSQCDAANFFSKKFISANCQTDSYLLDDLLTEANLVFRYNISKLLPEKKDFGTSVDFECQTLENPVEPFDKVRKEDDNNRDSVISAISDSDLSEYIKKIGMNDSGIQVNDSQIVCKICQLNLDSKLENKDTEKDLSVENTAKDATTSTNSVNENPLDKECNTDCATEIIETFDRETSPMPIDTHNVETMTKIETRNIGIKVCPATRNSCVGTSRVVFKDKYVSTPRVITTNKQTSMPKVHLLHKSIGTDIECYHSKADKQTNTIDITQVYLEAASNRSNMIKKVSRAEGTDPVEYKDSCTSHDSDLISKASTASTLSRGTSPISDLLTPPVAETDKRLCVHKGTQYEKQILENGQMNSKLVAECEKTLSKTQAKSEELIVQKENGFEPILVQNGNKEKQSFFMGRRSSLPKAIIQTVERGMNTKKVDTRHKETSTPPRETEDKSVTTGADLATKVDDKINNCISKLKAVSEKLGNNTKNATKEDNHVASEATPVHDKTNEKPVVAKPKFSILSFLGRRQSEGDILKAKDRDVSQPKRRDLLARKQTTNMAQMLQHTKEKEGGFFSFSKPKLNLKTQVVQKLGSAEELSVKHDLNVKSSSNNNKTGRSIPGRPPLPAPKAFKASPVVINKPEYSDFNGDQIMDIPTNKVNMKPQIIQKT